MGTWGVWSTCDDSCSARDGTGNQVRERSPDRPVANGGADCTEATSEEQSCDTVCPGNDAVYKQESIKYVRAEGKGGVKEIANFCTRQY